MSSNNKQYMLPGMCTYTSNCSAVPFAHDTFSHFADDKPVFPAIMAPCCATRNLLETFLNHCCLTGREHMFLDW